MKSSTSMDATTDLRFNPSESSAPAATPPFQTESPSASADSPVSSSEI
ncbi:MAG: hypothetical protein O3A00_07415 [Planctomycetota bacterium]|nr:hypothetical protein [Planctomycetota bacterium]